MGFSFLKFFSSKIRRAKEITIQELGQELYLLAQDKTECELTGITSNGTDCLYFKKNGLFFDIVFEAVTEAQIPYLEQLERFAKENKYASQLYDYKRSALSARSIPAIKLETKADIEQTILIAAKIQIELFGNNPGTKYEIVP